MTCYNSLTFQRIQLFRLASENLVKELEKLPSDIMPGDSLLR